MAIQIDATASGLSRTLQFNPLADWTRSMWIYAPTTADYHTVWFIYSDAPQEDSLGSYIYESAPDDILSSQTVLDLEVTNTPEFEYQQVAFTYSTWMFYTVVYVAASKTFYIYNDAVLVNTLTITDTTLDDFAFDAVTSTERIGGDLFGGDVGLRIAYDRVWQKALTVTDIYREMYAQSAFLRASLISDAPLTSTDDIDDWSITGSVSTVDGPSLPPMQSKQWRIYRFDLKPREEEQA